MRLIDADALKENLSESYDSLRKIYDGLRYNSERAVCSGQLATFLEVIMRIREAPTIDAEPVKHGRWLYSSIKNPRFRVCDQCANAVVKLENQDEYNYCPNCGAKMEVGDG